MPNISKNVIPRSNNPESTDERTTIKRGKYTRVMRCALPTKLCADVPTELAKNVHGNNPAKTNTGYGRPSDGIWANLWNRRVKISIFSSGCNIAQDAPSAVCL